MPTESTAKPRRVRPFLLFILAAVIALAAQSAAARRSYFLWNWNRDYAENAVTQSALLRDLRYDTMLVLAAREQTERYCRYDPSYVSIPYPGGDVPESQGVCSDVIVRAYRVIGIDLQKRVHEDMTRAFSEYPGIWRMDGPDPNIDHRRVPNLMKYFKRQNASLPISDDAKDYHPGDVVAWNLGGGITHIGMVVDEAAADRQRFLISHNIGAGPQLEDVLFRWRIIGHFRYPARSR